MARTQVVSPLPGTFYRRPAPDKPPYKEAGDRVAKGDVVGLVEVMKTFYEVTAEATGTITQFHIENEDAIQAGQVIADLET
jgi:biotin carboxyl carrier protein